MPLKVELPRDLWPRRGDWVGKVIAVYRSPGDKVSAGDPIAEVEIEKAILVIEAPVNGVITDIAVKPGATIRPGTVIAYIEPNGGARS